jgi:uncharacterized delta-60 repeat protein
MIIPSTFFSDNGTGFVSQNSIYVGGSFTTYKGVSANAIIKLTNYGNEDTFDNGTGFAGGGPVVYDIIQGDKIFAAGLFTSYRGTGAGQLIKIDDNGTIDTSFQTGTYYANSTIFCSSYAGSGKVYIGGNFTTYNSVVANNIIKLNSNATKDIGFDNSTGFNSDVYAIVGSSTIYVGGSFTSYKGSTANRIIRLNSNGSKDSGFDNSTGFNGTVNCITVDSDGKIYVGGEFTSYKGVTANRIIRLNTDGSKDTGFDNSTAFDGSVNCMAIDSNNKIYVGGAFTSYKSVTNNRIIRLNTDGSRDANFDNSTGFGNTVLSIAVDADNKLYAGGSFTSYKGVTSNRIIKLNIDGSRDSTFSTSTGFNNTVRKIIISV